MHVCVCIYVYTLSSSCHAASMDFPLFLTIHLYHTSLLAGLQTTSCVCTELLLIDSSWSSNTCISV